ncbi:toprim domain-containing protein [Chishuiella sp.]|uniref:toprim domain-containing protein n=1 Tax=Chishuiella sp. TaxID=1969467 RepID=UPI0028AD0005|nr:toprim domain-containing protein [Chishuiella sp.]
MNCKQFNLIKLEEVLASLGHLPTKQNEKEAWYLNPFGTETQASFKLDKKLNLWYLYSEGIGGNNTDFIMKYQNASVKEVLQWAEKQNFSSFQPQNDIHLQKSIPNYQIIEIKELQNENLKNYLYQRGLSQNVYPFIKEVHFTIRDKKMYAIGFENLSGGWELRNSFYKGSLLKKDISVINLNNNQEKNMNVVVFEGFTDALSFIDMKHFFKGDVLVMNSISLLNKTKEYLQNYSEINLFLDNDKSGENCKNEILKSFPEAKDHSKIYFLHKDLNDYLLSRIQIKNENRQQQTREEQQQNCQIFKRRR